ncbi:hypothetical protein ACXWTF_07245 [Thiomicrolovo sp. ZZH C-3]
MKEMIALLDTILPYLERHGMGTLVTICLSILLIATTIWGIAFIVDQKSIRNLSRKFKELIKLSRSCFEDANTSPYDDVVANSNTYKIIEFIYLYLISATMFFYGLLILITGVIVEPQVWWGKVVVILYGIVMIVIARFAKVAADKSLYRFKTANECMAS